MNEWLKQMNDQRKMFSAVGIQTLDIADVSLSPQELDYEFPQKIIL